MSSNLQLIRTGLWQWAKGTGLERFELLQAADEWVLRGTILTHADRGPAEAKYEIVCDGAWRTKSATIWVREGSDERKLHIIVENGGWYENGNANETVSGCVDIDLGWPPSTNTLPIRRLRLNVRRSRSALTAGWVPFPELKLEPPPPEHLPL